MLVPLIKKKNNLTYILTILVVEISSNINFLFNTRFQRFSLTPLIPGAKKIRKIKLGIKN
jgi:hypothetical protein